MGDKGGQEVVDKASAENASVISEAEALLTIQEQMDMTFANVKQVVFVLRARVRALQARVDELEAKMKVATPKGL